VGPEEQEESLEQELLGGPEPEGELQECLDHKPSMFEKRQAPEHSKSPYSRNIIDILWLFFYAAFK